MKKNRCIYFLLLLLWKKALWLSGVTGFIFQTEPRASIRPRPSSLIRSASASNTNHPEIYYNISSIPCREGTFQVTRQLANKEASFSLAYRLVRPMSLSSQKAAPLVVLHGGPSVPSNYLLPLAKVIPYRSILFYDQLGCGRSDEPTDGAAYSIDAAVKDLETILRKLSIRRFHLYGQSFGGILAFEYLKRLSERGSTLENDDEGCLSAIFSSTPCNVSQVEEEAQGLVNALPDPNLFRITHQCRTSDDDDDDGNMPWPLSDAYAAAGTVWRGTTAIPHYAATAPSPEATRTPSVLVLRGEYDFVTPPCVAPWKDLLCLGRSVRFQALQNCSHHGLLEQPQVYGETIDAFLAEYD